MVRLLWKLLPYLLVVGSLAMLFVAAMVLVKGAETAPTSADLATVTGKTPDKDWLTVTGGGLWLPDVIIETKKGKRDKEAKPARYYVPLVTEADATARGLAVVKGGAATPPKTTVFVKMSVAQFDAKYPNAQNTSVDDIFRAGPISGTRSRLSMLGGKFKTYVTDELKLPADSVTILELDDHPMQKNEAIGLAAFSVLAGVIGALWSARRWKNPGIA